MNEIYTKQFLRPSSTPEEHIIELRLSDTPLESEGAMEMDKILYDPEDDEPVLDVISHLEFEQKMEWGGPSGFLYNEQISYATILKYYAPDDNDVPEVASYPQKKGRIIQWVILFEAKEEPIPCTLEYYVFYRDPNGDIRKLHPFEHEIEITIPHRDPRDVIVTLEVCNKERALDCGRYYLAARLRGHDLSYLNRGLVQYINIVPSKTKLSHVDSNLVGLDDVYRQMNTLVKQKIFNDHRLAMNLSPAPINLHAAVMGSKGSGKTSFAQVLYDFYQQNGLLADGRLRISDAARWNKSWDDSSPIEREMSEVPGGMLYIENAASMIMTDARSNKEINVESLVRELQKGDNETAVILADTPERISQLLATADLRAQIGQVYKLPTLDLEQMMQVAQREAQSRGFVLTEGAKNAMKSYLSAIPDANTNDVNELMDAMIINMSERVVNGSQDLFQDKEVLSEIKAEDIPQHKFGAYERSMRKLNDLVGLKKLKYNIESHLNLVRFTQLRRQKGLVSTLPPLHMIFTGNPGTGKTTVAKLLGEIYASLGILKTGHVITADRKKLVGQYIGDTEDNTKRYLQQAHGNILLIDEAYTLVDDPNDKKDYGPKVLECLLEELGKEQTDMIIILAGYPDEMEAMLQSNKGLQSRFPYTFHFEDYSEQELLDIAVLTAQNSGYTFSPQALERVRNLIRREMERPSSGQDRKHFGNARFVTRLITSQIIPNMSRRVLMSAGSEPTSQLLSYIDAADVPTSVTDTDYPIDEIQINRTLKQLDEMIGLKEIKKTLHNLVSIARNKQQNGEFLIDTIPLQWTFTGSTGTGKSSVARLLAQLLHAFHLISSDHMTQLRMPQTQANTWTPYEIDQILRDTMKQAGQGLLFIDLDDVANNHIDVQWLRCKLTSLTAEMPGSCAFVIAVDDRRLSTHPIDMPISTSVIHFADYTAEELMTILQQRLDKHGYSMTDEASAEVARHIQALCNNRDSGMANARTIKHIYTALTSAAELRAPVPAGEADAHPLITKEDVLSIKWQRINTNRIGFGA
jgi:Cdc6-like AAA superfamily ATPase